jgi:2-C-methyl-D-erythritol 4-phosphate cytidylyltransferase
VVLAGGTGSRVGLQIPKQLLKIAGKSILQHTLEVFEAAPEIDEVLLLMAPGHVESARAVVEQAGLRKVTQVLEGGSTRNETTRTALGAIADEDCNVLFHDAVRPLLEPRIITDCVTALETYEAVDVAIPSADTIIVVDERDVITDIPVRDRLRRGQTPQGFRVGTIRRAYDLAAEDPGFRATDDCGVVLRYLPEVPIFAVTGSEQNMKVTHPIDIFIADKLFQLASQPSQSAGDAAELAERLTGATFVVLGGSSGIGEALAVQARECGADVFSFSRSTTGTDVQRREDVAAALRTAYDATGRIDYVVLTAGVLHRGALADMSDEMIAESIGVNILSAVHTARESLPYLAKSGGQLLLYTSSSYTRGRSGYSLYSSTKAALVNLTQALSDEWAPLGVRVNCINPERTATPMRTKAFGEEPEGSLLSSDAVAQTSLDVLLSGMTGQVIDVRKLDPSRPPVTAGQRSESDRIAAALVAVEDHAGSHPSTGG